MMKVTVLTVGKIKDKWITTGIAEYVKRLGAYCNLNIVELAEQRTPQNPSQGDIDIVLEKESQLILNNISPRATVVGLVIEGKELSSPQLAEFIDKSGQTCSEIVFIIGSSHGMSDKVKSACNLKLSFSPMTFPHQLMRLILTEQIYRAFSIIGGSSYHK